jgi:hypothetical protein
MKLPSDCGENMSWPQSDCSPNRGAQNVVATVCVSMKDDILLFAVPT